MLCTFLYDVILFAVVTTRRSFHHDGSPSFPRSNAEISHLFIKRGLIGSPEEEQPQSHPFLCNSRMASSSRRLIEQISPLSRFMCASSRQNHRFSTLGRLYFRVISWLYQVSPPTRRFFLVVSYVSRMLSLIFCSPVRLSIMFSGSASQVRRLAESLD